MGAQQASDAVVHARLGEYEHAFRFVAMASPCEVHLDGCGARDARAAADRAIAEVRRIEAKYSRYRDDSIVSRINAAAGRGEPIAVDSETAQLFDFAAQLYRQSDGLFDITSGVLRRVWNFREARLPTDGELAEICAQIGWAKAHWDGRAIYLPSVGMEIDFGGFGKEYAADRAAAIAEACGAKHGFVNLGGDLRAIGPRADGSAWSIGIQHPRRKAETVAQIELSRGALATSGDYERFIEIDGKRYCHILNPGTGMPVSHWQSVSVLAPVCVAAGALATIAMLKEAEALAVLEGEAAAYLAIRADGERFARDAAQM